MKKEKFKYNPETLSYEKVEVTWGERIVKLSLIIGPAVLLGFGFQILFSSIFMSPREKNLSREVDFLNARLDEMNSELTLALEVSKDIAKRDNEIYRVVFNAEPFPDEIRQMGTGGSDEYSDFLGFESSQKVIENTKMINQLQRSLYAQSKSFDEVISLAKEKEDMLASIPAIQPVSNEDLTRIASGFGYRIDPIYKTKKMHTGLDFTADTGTPVYATGNGTVVECEVKRWGYGQSVIIDHGFGYQSRYAHLSEFKCKPGDKVIRGQIIGLVGSTGKSTAPHLHYEVVKNGQKIDPIHFFHSDISPEQYERMIEMASNANQSFD
ncbi:M23 family metallopeptidase [Paracrocinitomix mangrovi]|uniref:M23 family metallopeptidase n=1 Tax=Paracrocinitomix mangrovi TaxID=2862509 RepID=UPI001C8EFFFA|nr:M23 family metallopeptidase [Paracrocinitomix mangrovi]UKN01876.1 M23 family metallopeptidase [Paracrocinitomix mangrovi]